MRATQENSTIRPLLRKHRLHLTTTTFAAATTSATTRTTSCSVLLLLLLLSSTATLVHGNIDYSSSSSSIKYPDDQYRSLSQQGNNDHNHRHYRHYHSQGGDYNGNGSYYYQERASSLSDIWLCLACALGWTVWFVNVTSRPTAKEESLVFDEQDSRTAMGHVLQVSLGEDSDGTGIPVYHAVVDYVVESPLLDEEPLQVRKCFTTDKLLEEGFANVQVLFLVDDPTTSILMEDYIEDKHQRFSQAPPSLIWYIAVYTIVAVLIGSSFIGAVHAIQHLDDESQQQIGWITLAVGIILLYPTALFLYLLLSRGWRTVGNLLTRPGQIIHGAASRFDCTTTGCGALMNPMEMLDDIRPPPTTTLTPRQPGGRGGGGGNNNNHNNGSTSGGYYGKQNLELAQLASMDGAGTATYYSKRNNSMNTAPKSPMYPNAGCGFGNFNIHMPTNPTSGEDSSVSSMSSAATPNTKKSTKSGRSNSSGQHQRRVASPLALPTMDSFTRPTTTSNGGASSKLEKYEKGLMELEELEERENRKQKQRQEQEQNAQKDAMPTTTTTTTTRGGGERSSRRSPYPHESLMLPR